MIELDDLSEPFHLPMMESEGNEENSPRMDSGEDVQRVKRPGAGRKRGRALWREVELAVCAGMRTADAARQWGLSESAVRKKARDEGWVVPRLVAERRRNLGLEDRRDCPRAADVVAASLAELGERNAILVAEHAASLIAEAAQARLVAPPATWSDLSTAARLVDRATGRDKPQIAVQVNTFQSGLWQ